MKAQITFLALVQDIDDYNKAEHGEKQMVSRIVFSLEFDGLKHDQLVVEVSRPRWSDYKTAPLTFGSLSHGLMGGPWNHEAFADLADDYYRSALELSVSRGEASDVWIRNNRIDWVKTYDVDIEVGWSPPP
ncbi:MAG: hypothetical protein V3T53_02455 [Phycisphaerales bacterium]